MRRGLLFVLMALVAGTVSAAEVSGTWSGRLQTDISKFPEKYRAQVKAGLAKTKLTLTFKKDHTYVSVGSGPDGKAHTSTGTWSQKKNSIVLVTKTYDGKNRTGDPVRTVVLSPDGRTMTMAMQTKSNPKTGAVAPAVKIIFVKTK